MLFQNISTVGLMCLVGLVLSSMIDFHVYLYAVFIDI